MKKSFCLSVILACVCLSMYAVLRFSVQVPKMFPTSSGSEADGNVYFQPGAKLLKIITEIYDKDTVIDVLLREEVNRYAVEEVYLCGNDIYLGNNNTNTDDKRLSRIKMITNALNEAAKKNDTMPFFIGGSIIFNNKIHPIKYLNRFGEKAFMDSLSFTFADNIYRCWPITLYSIIGSQNDDENVKPLNLGVEYPCIAIIRQTHKHFRKKMRRLKGDDIEYDFNTTELTKEERDILYEIFLDEINKIMDAKSDTVTILPFVFEGYEELNLQNKNLDSLKSIYLPQNWPREK